MLRLVTTFAIAGTVLPSAQAILVTPGSPCSVKCGNVQDSTPTDDLVCGQDNYAVGVGQTFKSCLECELSSGYSQGNQTDIESSLYNLRLSASYCLWGFPKNDFVESTPCTTSKACDPFREAVQFHNLSVDVDGYDYCASWPIGDDQDFAGCRKCLQLDKKEYMANFFSALQAGCEQQPIPGVGLGLSGDVFSTDNVEITAPSPTAAVDPDWFDHGPLSLGAKVGIAIGGLILILAIAGFCIVWNGKRRRRAYLRTLEKKYGNQGWPSPQNHAEMFETPVSQRPLRGWDDSPMSVQTEAEKPWPRYVSPYSSQFNSPVNGNEGPSMAWPPAALSPQREIGVALGGEDPNNKWAPSAVHEGKGKDKQPESYEMYNVDSAGGNRPSQHTHTTQAAPVLGHPGFGRKSDSPPLRYNLNEGQTGAEHAY